MGVGLEAVVSIGTGIGMAARRAVKLKKLPPDEFINGKKKAVLIARDGIGGAVAGWLAALGGKKGVAAIKTARTPIDPHTYDWANASAAQLEKDLHRLFGKNVEWARIKPGLFIGKGPQELHLGAEAGGLTKNGLADFRKPWKFYIHRGSDTRLLGGLEGLHSDYLPQGLRDFLIRHDK